MTVSYSEAARLAAECVLRYRSTLPHRIDCAADQPNCAEAHNGCGRRLASTFSRNGQIIMSKINLFLTGAFLFAVTFASTGCEAPSAKDDGSSAAPTATSTPSGASEGSGTTKAPEEGSGSR